MEGKDVVEVPATVAVPAMGVEVSVIGKERWEELRRLRAEGQSISHIARSTGLDRKTVRAALAKTAWAPYQRAAVVETLLSSHAEWLARRAPQVSASASGLGPGASVFRQRTGGDPHLCHDTGLLPPWLGGRLRA